MSQVVTCTAALVRHFSGLAKGKKLAVSQKLAYQHTCGQRKREINSVSWAPKQHLCFVFCSDYTCINCFHPKISWTAFSSGSYSTFLMPTVTSRHSCSHIPHIFHFQACAGFCQEVRVQYKDTLYPQAATLNNKWATEKKTLIIRAVGLCMQCFARTIAMGFLSFGYEYS